MGAKCCCHRQSISEQQPKMAGSPDHQDVGDPSLSISDKSKQQCLKEGKKREFHSPDNSVTMVGHLSTLEECLLDSPLLNPPCIIKQLKMVHPSSPKVHTNFRTPRNSFSSDRRGEIGEADEENLLNSDMSTCRRGNLRKRVRFTLPEEADIIIFYSPKEKFEECLEYTTGETNRQVCRRTF